jgi:hypothetical protein
LAEHAAALDEFTVASARLAGTAWARPPAPGKWSPAAVVLHVCGAYEFVRDAAAGGAGMRLLVSRPAAWLGRTVVLPALLASGRFPRGAAAPREVVPDLAEAARVTPDAAAERLARAAAAAAAALRRAAAERPATRGAARLLRPAHTARRAAARQRPHAPPRAGAGGARRRRAGAGLTAVAA